MYMYTKGILAKKKSYGFKYLHKLETSPHENQIIFAQVGDFTP